MRVLLDENVDYDFKYLLPAHEVRHVDDLGWKGKSNGQLLDSAEAEGFEVLVTADKRIRFQQDLSARKLSLAIIEVHPKNFANLTACAPELIRILPDMNPGQVYLITLHG